MIKDETKSPRLLPRALWEVLGIFLKWSGWDSNSRPMA